jgi:hypothetical protein
MTCPSAASLGSGWHPQLTSRCGRYFIYRPTLGTWTPYDPYPTVRINQQTPDLDHSQRSHRRPWPASPPPSGDHRRDACTLCFACRQPEAPPLQRRRAVLRVLVLPPRSVDAPGYVSPRRLAPSAAGGGHALSHSLARRGAERGAAFPRAAAYSVPVNSAVVDHRAPAGRRAHRADELPVVFGATASGGGLSVPHQPPGPTSASK